MKLFNNGKDAFQDIIYEIKNAKQTIEIQMFIWRNDNIGQAMIEALLEAAYNGVSIVIYKDIYGALFETSEENCQSLFHNKIPLKIKMTSWILRNIFYRMNVNKKTRKYINDKSKFNELSHLPQVKIISKIEKNHTKYFMIDNQTLFLGGMNIEDKEVTYDTLGKVYKDYMVRIDSKTEVRYFKDRIKQNKKLELNREIEYIINSKERLETKELINLIQNAKTRVFMTMAYFGNKEIKEALFKIKKEGADIQIITSNFSNVQTHYNKKILTEYAKEEIQIYFHPELVHAKAMLIDERLIIGSINLNDAGIFKLGECSIVLKDKQLIKEYLDDFTKLKNESVRSNKKNLKYHKLRSFLEKVFS